jgi:hypothetical protein
MAKNSDFELTDELDLRLRDAVLTKAMINAKANKHDDYDEYQRAKVELREFRQFWR